MGKLRLVTRLQIRGEFTGFDGGMLFELDDGTAWMQAAYTYWYHYAYRPTVALLSDGINTYLRVEGCAQEVAVRPIGRVIHSRIIEHFDGWHGDSVYALTNGQIWQQAAALHKDHHAYKPEVTIFDPGGGDVMRVAGTQVRVRRIQ